MLGTVKHDHPAYRQLLGYEPGTPADKMSVQKKNEVSPVHFVSADDPPILIVHGDADKIVPIEHARVLDAALEKAKVSTELFIVKGGNHGIAGAGHPAAVKRASAFMREHLLGEGAKSKSSKPSK